MITISSLSPPISGNSSFTLQDGLPLVPSLMSSYTIFAILFLASTITYAALSKTFPLIPIPLLSSDIPYEESALISRGSSCNWARDLALTE